MKVTTLVGRVRLRDEARRFCVILVLMGGISACATLPGVQTVPIEDGKSAFAAAGQGSPVVVLESGMGPSMDTWTPIFDSARR